MQSILYLELKWEIKKKLLQIFISFFNLLMVVIFIHLYFILNKTQSVITGQILAIQ